MLRVRDRYDDEVLEHLDVGRIHDARLQLDLLDLAGARDLRCHHAAAGRTNHGLLRELVLNFLKSTLHLLRLLQDLHEVGHFLVAGFWLLVLVGVGNQSPEAIQAPVSPRLPDRAHRSPR